MESRSWSIRLYQRSLNRLLSNKGSEDEDHDSYQGLDLVLKVLERYQITLEKLQEFIEKHLTSPLPTTGSWMSFGSKILLILLRFLQMIIIPRDMRCAAEQGNVYLQVLMVCCGLQIVNWSWMLVRCNPNVEIKLTLKGNEGKEHNTPIAKDQSLIQLYKKQADVFKQAVRHPTIQIGGDRDLGWTTEWDRVLCQGCGVSKAILVSGGTTAAESTVVRKSQKKELAKVERWSEKIRAVNGADEVFRLPIRVWIWPMDERLEQDKDSTKIKGQKSRGNRIKGLEDYKKKKKKQDRGAGQRSRE
ncbi:hypothetical protein PPACK8108_LOCUS23878 [Phakopsora pachyrhizi]|uniref:Uncharacterized protein n=1 Tax=Phakopsora pachyrhizi TaxID=170000 RepID=A0AAV0BQ67_PHAPC|nr:hypothetical protein PPACK8108_LOCUS23878 [Phakopsora pachyrhizi]